MVVKEVTFVTEKVGEIAPEFVSIAGIEFYLGEG
jgi:hypothetical protein